MACSHQGVPVTHLQGHLIGETLIQVEDQGRIGEEKTDT
jgi:hypothetical protein